MHNKLLGLCSRSGLKLFITILSGLTVHLSPKVGTNQVLVSYLHSLSSISDLHYQLLCPLNFQHPHLRDAETLRVTASHSHQPIRFISHNLQPPFLPDLRLQTAPPSGHVVVHQSHTVPSATQCSCVAEDVKFCLPDNSSTLF